MGFIGWMSDTNSPADLSSDEQEQLAALDAESEDQVQD